MEHVAPSGEDDNQIKYLSLDGATLEGGGQLIRNALTLSALTARPVRITNIRGNRPKGGGLKSSHAAAVKFLSDVTGSTVTGVEVGSKTIEFTPPSKPSYEQTLRREFHIKIETPGSVFLIFQALYPWLIYRAADLGKPVKLSITGGTNVTFSPSFEYISEVLVPTFAKVGLPELKIELLGRGWTTGRTQLGTVVFEVQPLSAKCALPAFHLSERGNITKISVSILASCEFLPQSGGSSKPKKLARGAKSRESVRSLLESEVLEAIGRSFKDVDVELALSAESGSEKRLYLLLVAHTSNGYRLGRDWLFDQKVTDPRKAIRTLVEGVVGVLKTEIASGACVDEHMRDQLVVFQALAEGKCTVNGGAAENGSGRREPSLHTQTAMWIAHELLQVKFEESGECEGRGLKAGLASADEGSEDLTRRMEEVILKH